VKNQESALGAPADTVLQDFAGKQTNQQQDKNVGPM